MKFFRIFFFIMLLGIVVSCTKYGNYYLPPKVAGEARILATNPGTNSISYFRHGDRIGFFPVNRRNNIPESPGDLTNRMNIQYTLGKDGWEAKPGEEYYPDKGITDVFAYFPYDDDLCRAFSKMDLTAYPFDLSGDQESKDVDFLWTKTEISDTNHTLVLSFEHIMSRLIINLLFADKENISMNLKVYNIQTDCRINLGTGVVSTTGKSEHIIPAALTEATTRYDMSYEIIIAPQSIMSGTPLFLIEYGKDITLFTLGQDIIFTSENSYIFNLIIDRESTMPAKKTKNIFPVISER